MSLHAASEWRRDSGSESFSDRSGEPGALHTPHDREEAVPASRREGGGEESYPTSPYTRPSGSELDAKQQQQRDAFAPKVGEEEPAARAGGFEDAREAPAELQRTLTAPGSAQGFGSAQSSLARSASVSDAEDASLGESEDRLQEVAQMAAAAAAAAPAAAVAAEMPGEPPATAGVPTQPAAAAPAAGAQSAGSSGSGDSEDSLAAEMAAARALAAAGGGANGASGELPPAHVQPGAPAGVTRRVSATFAAAREAAIAAAAVTEQHQAAANSRLVRALSTFT